MSELSEDDFEQVEDDDTLETNSQGRPKRKTKAPTRYSEEDTTSRKRGRDDDSKSGSSEGDQEEPPKKKQKSNPKRKAPEQKEIDENLPNLLSEEQKKS